MFGSETRQNRRLEPKPNPFTPTLSEKPTPGQTRPFRAPSGWRVLTADGGAQVGSAATRASRWVPREESAPVLCLSPSPREQTVPKGFLRGNKLQRKQSSDTLKRRLDHLHHVGKSRHEQGKSGWVLSEL